MLTEDLLTKLLAIDEVAVVGPLTMESRGGAVSFTVAGIHPHDLGQFLDSQGIAVRTGHHCAWPLTRSLGVPATTRASLYLYNTIEDNDALDRWNHISHEVFQIMNLDTLYQEVILDHYKNPLNKKSVANFRCASSSHQSKLRR